jgi:hypothetical protein
MAFWLYFAQKREMEELQGESIKEMFVGKFKQLKKWLKPNPNDSIVIISLKMIYKIIAVLLLIAFSPVIIVILVFVFFAAL